jgi:hypothetical protein
MSAEHGSFTLKKVAIAAPLAGVIAAVLNLIVYSIARGAGADFVGQMDPSSPAAVIPMPIVAVASFVPALFAAGFLLALSRWTKNGAGAFGMVAGVFFLLSLGGPATMGGASPATKVALGVMHLVAAATITGVLLRRGRAN